MTSLSSRDGIELTKRVLFLTEVSSSTVVPATERSDISCTADSIEVFIPETILPHVIGRNITWRDDACALEYNGTHYVGSVSLAFCGTTVQMGEKNVTFSNDIIVHTSDNEGNDIYSETDVTFGEDYETVVPVECIYPRENHVMTNYVPVKQNIRFFERRFGELELDMQQFTSESYDTLIVPDPDTPRQIPLDSDVYMRIALRFDPKSLRLDAKKCIATSTASPADAKWHPLIENGCPVGVTRLLSGNQSIDVRFAFKAFDFRQDSTGVMYIHCEVSVCGVHEMDCVTGCQSRNKRSASGNSRTGSHLVSMGPFVVPRDQDASKDSSVALPTVFSVVCLLIAIVASVIALIGWTRRPKEERKTNSI